MRSCLHIIIMTKHSCLDCVVADWVQDVVSVSTLNFLQLILTVFWGFSSWASSGESPQIHAYQSHMTCGIFVIASFLNFHFLNFPAGYNLSSVPYSLCRLQFSISHLSMCSNPKDPNWMWKNEREHAWCKLLGVGWGAPGILKGPSNLSLEASVTVRVCVCGCICVWWTPADWKTAWNIGRLTLKFPFMGWIIKTRVTVFSLFFSWDFATCICPMLYTCYMVCCCMYST